MATSHGGDFVPAGPTHDLGYEPDKFAVKTILLVPGAVLVTMLVVFIITDLIFGNIFGPKATVIPPTVPAGAERNGAPLNDRFAHISSTDPKAEVQQPRLEGVVQRQVYAKDGQYKEDGTPKNTDPSNLITGEMITTQPTPKGNSPRYHADDLQPANVPAISKPSTPGAIPIEKAMELATGAWAKALPAAQGAAPLGETWDRPKESNGGNARWPAPAPPKKDAPAPKGGQTEKEPDKKEPEAKKEEPKKQ